MKQNNQQTRIAIIGGGWAGLAAAVELSRHNYSVSVYESSPQLGGRARSIQWKGMTLDNGQHLMIGAYQQMLDLLKILQADINSLFKRLPHRMLMLDATKGGPVFDLNLPTFPEPLHLLFGVLRTPYLSLLEKAQLLLRFNRLLNTPVIKDLTVSDWLASARLPQTYVDYVLKPVCLAALTTHPHQASARAFQSVLQQTFNAAASFTDLLIPTTDLGRVFPALAEQFILQQGGSVNTRCKVLNLQQENSNITKLVTAQGEAHFDYFILATPATVTTSLLGSFAETDTICAQIKQLRFEPVATLYLQFNNPVTLPAPMTGMINGFTEWVFERATSGHDNVLAVVISAQGEHLQLAKHDLLQHIINELKINLPGLPELIDSKLIIEKNATIQCHPDVDQFRPGIDTPLNNLKLCGDYVYIEENNQPGLPSTLEGALRSGVKCAQTLINIHK